MFYLMVNSTYNWLLHYNPYTQMWNMFHRDDLKSYWGNGIFKHPFIKSKDVKTLEAILKETDGLEEKIIEKLKEFEKKTINN